jgi:hypothetical protein
MDTTQNRSYATLPDNWREVALASPESAKGVRAIAAAFAILIDGEGDLIITEGEINKHITVADKKYGIGYHSRARAEYIIETSPACVRAVFSGSDPRKFRAIYDELKAKKSLGKHEEPIAVDRIRKTATAFELRYELVKMLSNDDLEKVLKYAGARLHPDNKETGNEDEFKRLNELWSKLKEIGEGEE